MVFSSAPSRLNNFGGWEFLRIFFGSQVTTKITKICFHELSRGKNQPNWWGSFSHIIHGNGILTDLFEYKNGMGVFPHLSKLNHLKNGPTPEICLATNTGGISHRLQSPSWVDPRDTDNHKVIVAGAKCGDQKKQSTYKNHKGHVCHVQALNPKIPSSWPKVWVGLFRSGIDFSKG